ncbi:MAG: acetate--CoA ligase family protein [Deltaproteobacteria bacterium]|nr:acetate--CoA ligase family protein [Deltaproteobacteria bacterium]
MSGLNAIFSPRSVALVGASTQPGKVGHDIFANILRGGYTGILYPINPKSKSILSVRTYPSMKDIDDEVDLAIFVVSPEVTLKSMEEAIKKKIKGAVIVSAGFKEVGGRGAEIEKEIVAMARKAGIRIIGPNCLGIINPSPAISLNASFSARMPSPGNISFISQSGALCTSVLDFAAEKKIGFSKFVSIGNKADIDELDLLQYLHEDEETEVIMAYVEELKRGPEFIEAVKKITGGKKPTPVLVIKSGRTSAGAKAAASHTGALAGSEEVYNAIFEQSGIIAVDSIDELFDYASAFAYKNESSCGKFMRKVPEKNRMAIVTNAGGPGIIATDMTISTGLELATFDEATVAELAKHLPATANLHNPVDVIGDASPDRYENALRAVINDKNVDGSMVILTPQSMTNVLAIAEGIVKIAKQTHKPIICSFMGVVDVSRGVQYLQDNGIPVYRFPEKAAKALSALFRYSTYISRAKVIPFDLKYDQNTAGNIIRGCLEKGINYLGEIEGLDVLKCYGFNVLPTQLATSPEQAAEIAEKNGYPVVMKIVSKQIIHKSDAGGVILRLENAEDVKKAYNKIVQNAKKFNESAVIDGVLVQKMATPGEEVILGMNRYKTFGPLIMFGVGGVFVEIFKDVSFGLAPLNREDAQKMIRKIKGYKLFQGFRGMPVADIETLERSIVSLSDLALNHPEISEMDINPLLVHEKGKGATVADCRIILSQDEK